MNGWVKLHRKMLQWEWYKNIPAKVLWIHLLLTVNHEDGTWQGIDIKRGQTWTSLSNLASETGLTIKQVRSGLNRLTKGTQVDIQTARNGTLITINKYDDYQEILKPEGKQRAHKRHAKGQQTRIEEERKKEERKKIYANFWDFDLSNMSQNSRPLFEEYCNSILTPEYDNLMFMEQPLTAKQLYGIIKEHGFEKTKAIIGEVNNWKELHEKNISANLTIKNWLNRRAK